MLSHIFRRRRCLASACALVSTQGFVARPPHTRVGPRWLSSLEPQSANSFVLEGKLVHIGDEQTFESGRSKREFVISLAGPYPNEIKFDLWGERKRALDYVEMDSDVVVSFSVKGNSWAPDPLQPKRYFVNLNAWSVKPASVPTSAMPQASMPRAPPDGPPAGVGLGNGRGGVIVESSPDPGPSYDVSPLEGGSESPPSPKEDFSNDSTLSF